MTYIEKGTHFDLSVIFLVTVRSDGTHVGDIRVAEAKGRMTLSHSAYDPMDGTFVSGKTKEEVVAKLDAALAGMIAEASK